jgi:hypothetical protein
MNTQNKDELRDGYIKVQLDYAPTTNAKKFAKWCEKYGFSPIGSGRRAWCSSLNTYLRDASGVAFADGEMFLFYEEDLVDVNTLITTAINNKLEQIKSELPEKKPAKQSGDLTRDGWQKYDTETGFNQALTQVLQLLESKSIKTGIINPETGIRLDYDHIPLSAINEIKE